jgi:hypothetical protein
MKKLVVPVLFGCTCVGVVVAEVDWLAGELSIFVAAKGRQPLGRDAGHPYGGEKREELSPTR